MAAAAQLGLSTGNRPRAAAGVISRAIARGRAISSCMPFTAHRSCSAGHLRSSTTQLIGRRSLRASRALPAGCVMAAGKVPWGQTPWACGGRAAPPDIFGIGANYLAHVQELGRPTPTTPLVFPKATSSFNTGPYIVLPEPTVEAKVDYEGELGVVLGPEPCKDVSTEDAMRYVYGYVVAHDGAACRAARHSLSWCRYLPTIMPAVAGIHISVCPCDSSCTCPAVLRNDKLFFRLVAARYIADSFWQAQPVRGAHRQPVVAFQEL